MTFRYLLGLGSNESAEQHITAMIEALLVEFGVMCVSPVCQTPCAKGEGRDYLNAVVYLKSTLSPPEVRTLCKSIESSLGRIRPSSAVTADIDLLYSWDSGDRDSYPVVAEAYLQPLIDSVLGKTTVGSVLNTVSLNLNNGLEFGACVAELKAA
ncbi:2-amino-4-hydroxy-6-hydroxymethyldihydropteridine diphosphokinase [Parendozoicomonas haliclonae]|uniref:2-amino-4-hydroxy-6-hydroxymethyldihydropteridine diphosphokinase n=1 Tax=Parendozoicomonas haliclonae TaxID=1960125 RepID=A0A1X7ADZ8_9GAMM|nr:2-amino-4-hydroxy-6-hydroxymethyldihydropteridine diphosphokinase [Parendozoicomonas haliclonae]SMA31727.1 7, 8-dihydro-6-hydroxymethylpterin-pyrophosphokinase (HPPK) [Parendozoicomonas haliclonae]